MGNKSYAMACNVSSCKSGEIGSNPLSMINNCDLSFCGPWIENHTLVLNKVLTAKDTGFDL